MTKAPMPSRRRKTSMLAGYGVGDFGLNIYWNSLSIWLVFWYTDIVGISPEVAGLIFLAGAIWDAISDPIVATLSERVKTRHGTYRPFLLYASPMLGISLVCLFWVPPFEGGLLIGVLLISGMIARTAYTLVAIPYAALTTRLSFDSLERTELSGVRMFFAFGGLLVVSMVFHPLAEWFSDGPVVTGGGFQVAVIAGAAVATLSLLMCFFATKERPLPRGGEAPHPRHFIWSRQLFARNKALHMLLLIVFCQSGATSALFISMVFFVETHADTFTGKEVILTALALATMAGVPIWTLVIRKLGRRRTWATVTVLVALSGFHMLISGPLLLRGIPLQIVFIGFCFSAFAVMIWSFVPDTVEFGEIRTDVRSEGMVFGSVLVMQKLSGGLIGLLVAHVLAGIGYDAEATIQSAATANGLVVFLSCLPAGLLISSLIPVSLFPFTRQMHGDFVDRLARQRVIDD